MNDDEDNYFDFTGEFFSLIKNFNKDNCEDFEKIEKYIFNFPDIVADTRDSTTPLFLAVSLANPQVVCLLLENGAPPNAKIFGKRIIDIFDELYDPSKFSDMKDILDLLLRYNLKLNVRDRSILEKFETRHK